MLDNFLTKLAAAQNNKGKAAALFNLYAALCAILHNSIFATVENLLTNFSQGAKVLEDAFAASGNADRINADKLGLLNSIGKVFNSMGKDRRHAAVNQVLVMIEQGYLPSDSDRDVWNLRDIINRIRISVGELNPSKSMVNANSVKVHKGNFNACHRVALAALAACKFDMAVKYAGYCILEMKKLADIGAAGGLSSLKTAQVVTILNEAGKGNITLDNVQDFWKVADADADAAKARALTNAIELTQSYGYSVSLLTSVRRDAKEIASEREKLGAE